MIDFRACYQDIKQSSLRSWLPKLSENIEQILTPKKHGHLEEWLQVFEQLPPIKAESYDLKQDLIRIGSGEQLSGKDREFLIHQLKTMMPWRKGPFNLFDIHIDTEWRSDFKWRRLENEIAPLLNKTILDVGCGNGYHCFRMLGAGAKLVIGVEPLLRYLVQFQLLKHFISKSIPVHLLPLSLELLPSFIPEFDTVFSMGVLYHRKSPIDHLSQLKRCLKPGGELVLETLVVNEEYGSVLVPEDRYAKMRNVWFIPSCSLLERWLSRLGFVKIRVSDQSITTIEEQRATDWMQTESLADFLDASDSSKTIESYPAPQRAIFIANKPK